ncbi:hypothetical protein ACQCP0_25885, partial [Ralstonia pseudosolanacearum]|uniref:hypothetical protein n=1 Tax=Ralstonia pseudosolanacearum TaxID=1310165 RepID=UPI003CEBC2F6
MSLMLDRFMGRSCLRYRDVVPWAGALGKGGAFGAGAHVATHLHFRAVLRMLPALAPLAFERRDFM